MATKYLVLQRVKDPGAHAPRVLFALVAEEIETHGPQTAIRKAAEALDVGEEGGIFVAVPLSNWTEEPVAVVTPPPRLHVGVTPGQTTIESAVEEEQEAPDADADEEEKP
jgi:hypothetical protein